MGKKVRWGILGTANIARKQTIPGLQMADNAVLYAVAGRNPEKVKQFKEDFGFLYGYNSLDELLEDENVDAVYIPLSNDLHKEWVMKAADHHKNILCEKPLAPNPEDEKEMIDYCREKGVILAEAFAYLHSPLIKEVVDVIKSGEIGDITFMELQFYSKKWPAEDIRLRKDLYGGCTYDLGCYHMSLLQRILEEQPSDIKAFAHYTDTGVDDFSSLFLEYPSGVKASLLCGMFSSQRGSRLFVHGTEAMLELPRVYNEKGDLTYSIRRGHDIELRKINVPHNYMLEVTQFGNCVLGKESAPLVSNEYSLEVARSVAEAVHAIGYFEER